MAESEDNMKYFMVFGTMFNNIVIANSEDEVDGKIIRELTEEEANEHIRKTTSYANANY